MTKTISNPKTNPTLYLIPVVILVLLSGTGVNNDNSFVNELKSRLSQYNKNYHLEKAYLLTDRYVYRPGENIWFKGFVSSPDIQQRQSSSQDLFIKLLNSKGEEIIYRRYPLDNSQTAGRLLIPRTSIPGKYWLVAYTGWMKNSCTQEAYRKEILISKYFDKRFQVEAMYDKIVYYPEDTMIANIRILDPAHKPVTGINFDYTIGSYNRPNVKGNGSTDMMGAAKIKEVIPGSEELLMLTILIRSRKLSGDYTLIIPSVTRNPDVTFFPEGDNLVIGLRNMMAFKAVNSLGQPAIISGEITDHKGNTIQSVWTDSYGEGKFDYLPSADTCYLRITRPKDISKRYPIPMANGSGFVINLVESTADTIKIGITSSDNQSLTTSYWIAVMDKQVVWSDNISFIGSSLASIPVKDLKSGILQVSVFDQNHHLVTDRLVNVRNKSAQLLVKTDHKVYHSRQRVNLMLEYPGCLTKVDLALSVSLRDLSTNSLMTDFTTVINANQCDSNSRYSFGYNSMSDIGLLTTGYRSVYWNEVMEATDGSEPFTRQDGLSGKVFDKKKNPSQHAKVRVTHIPNYRSYETQSDENGVFQVDFGSDIIDYNYLKVDAYDALGKVNLITAIDQSYVEKLKATLSGECENNQEQKYFDVLSYGEPDLVYALRYGPGKFRKSVTETRKKYDPNQYADYTNVLDIIQDLKPYKLDHNNIIFNNNGDDYNAETMHQGGAIIVINGTLKGNSVEILKNLLPSDITNINISTSLLDVHKYTVLNFNGVIEITTIQGMYRYRQPAIQIGMDVLNVDREFYSPDYSVESTASGDNRKTLYWNSKLVIYPGRPMVVSFYTSDINGVYYGHIVGIDAVGNPVEGEFNFIVESP